MRAGLAYSNRSGGVVVSVAVLPISTLVLSLGIPLSRPPMLVGVGEAGDDAR